MFSLFKKRWFLIAIGVLLLVAFIWWAGPFFAFADYHPLASVTARVVTIVLLIAVVFGCMETHQGQARDHAVRQVGRQAASAGRG
jgi:type VI protein secretion system component VasK